jgi:hypothetical protein
MLSCILLQTKSGEPKYMHVDRDQEAVLSGMITMSSFLTHCLMATHYFWQFLSKTSHSSPWGEFYNL